MSFIPSHILLQLDSDLVDEANDNTVYLGYLKPGTVPGQGKCRIIRKQKTDTVTTTMFPNGIDDFEHEWNARTGLNYLHRK